MQLIFKDAEIENGGRGATNIIFGHYFEVYRWNSCCVEKQTIQMGLSVVAFLQTQTNCLRLAAVVKNILVGKQMTKYAMFVLEIFKSHWKNILDIFDQNSNI